MSADEDARARYRAFRSDQQGAGQLTRPAGDGDAPAPAREHTTRRTHPPTVPANVPGSRPPLPDLDAPPPARRASDQPTRGEQPRARPYDDNRSWDDEGDSAPRRWTDRFRIRRDRRDDEWDDQPRRWTDRFRVRRRSRADDEWEDEAWSDSDRFDRPGRSSRRFDRSAPGDNADDAAYDDTGENQRQSQTGSGHRLSTLRRRGRRKRVPLTPALRAQRRKRRYITWAVVAALILVSIPIINSPVGAWGADALRATLGPRLTAQVESYYFGFTDTVTRLKDHVFGEPKNAPWAAAQGTPLPTNQTPVPGRKGLPLIMPLPPVTPVISPALPGEGQWASAGLPGPSLQIWPIPMAKSFVRPDPDRPYAVVMLVAIDLRQARIHMVDGTTDPVAGGPGAIPSADQSATSLLAAFNGGFKASDGGFGLMTDGRTYLPAVNNAATLALYGDGTVRMGAWGTPAVPTANLVAFRQNGDMLIQDGKINQSVYTDGYAWGAPILANIYTWRSAIAMTSSGVLIYAAGNAITAETMAKALAAAGAQQAMELDINPVWVRFNTYSLNNGHLVANKLRTDMYGTSTQYLAPYSRDFIYVTRVMPADWPTTDPHVSRQGG